MWALYDVEEAVEDAGVVFPKGWRLFYDFLEREHALVCYTPCDGDCDGFICDGLSHCFAYGCDAIPTLYRHLDSLEVLQTGPEVSAMIREAAGRLALSATDAGSPIALVS